MSEQGGNPGDAPPQPGGFDAHGDLPTPQPRMVVCPYCGAISAGLARCTSCEGRFDPLSRQATQNVMGPWYFLDPQVPTRPGCSYDTIRGLVSRGVVKRDSVVRGPTTRQFWMRATRVPGIAHLVGVCHACQAPAGESDYACASCGVVFEVDRARQDLGLGPVRQMGSPGGADAGAVVGVPRASVPQAPVPASVGPASTPLKTPAPTATSAPGARGARTTHPSRRRPPPDGTRIVWIVAGAVACVVVIAWLGWKLVSDQAPTEPTSNTRIEAPLASDPAPRT